MRLMRCIVDAVHGCISLALRNLSPTTPAGTSTLINKYVITLGVQAILEFSNQEIAAPSVAVGAKQTPPPSGQKMCSLMSDTTTTLAPRMVSRCSAICRPANGFIGGHCVPWLETKSTFEG